MATTHPRSSIGIELTTLSGSISSVAVNDNVTIVSYTVPSGKRFFIDRADATGTGDGIYQMKIAGNLAAEQRTAWTDRNAKFVFDSILANAGETIELKVTNNNPGFVADYRGNIVGLLL